MKKNSLIKFILFLFAYIPIYLIIALKCIKPNKVNFHSTLLPVLEIVSLNKIPLFLILLVIFLILFFLYFQKKALKTSGNPIFTITSINSQNKEYIVYFSTYVLPFVALETNSFYDVLAYLVMFFTMGFIYSNTNLIYTNPMLLLFGYELYEVETESSKRYICISKHKLNSGDKPQGIKLDDNTLLISKWTKEN